MSTASGGSATSGKKRPLSSESTSSTSSVSARRSRRSTDQFTPSTPSLSTPTPTTTTHLSIFDGLSSSSSSSSLGILQSELSALRSELEHERSLRSIERRKYAGSESRLKSQIAFLTEEADRANALVEEIRTRADADMERMSLARREAVERLRKVEGRLEAVEAGVGDERAADLERGMRRRVEMLEERLEAADEEAERLRGRLEEAEGRAAEARRRAARLEADEEEECDEECDEDEEERFGHGDRGATDMAADTSAATTPRPKKRMKRKSPSSVSPAPPAVLSELNRVRTKVAESERANRQLRRKVEELQRKASQMVHHRESARRAEAKTEQMEQALKDLRKEREAGRAAEARWDDFRKKMEEMFGEGTGSNTGATREEERDAVDTPTLPPEIAMVTRHVRQLQSQLTHAEKERSDIQSKCDSSQRRVAALERRIHDDATSLEGWRKEKKDLERAVEASGVEVRKIKAQERIWQREADGLRALLKTYDDMGEHRTAETKSRGDFRGGALGKGSPSMIGAAASKGQKDDGGATVHGLEVSLGSAREQIQILTDGRNAAQEELEAKQTELKKLQTEHERVLEKFGKLREALHGERDKAAKAEERACHAEALVGKGSFNETTTRALHLRSNPFTEALLEKHRKEVDALKRTLEERERELASMASDGANASGTATTVMRTGGTVSGKDALSSLDAQKLHQRLKESFKEQIGLFREGVYLITGLKVDMYTDAVPHRPRFRVRSMYAEREEDHLMFQWPKVKKAGGEGSSSSEPSVGSASSLDLLDTELAQVLSKTDSFRYVTEYNSVPAFMAGVTLNLFENQTLVG